MSIVSAFLVFLLCLSMHVCHARHSRLFSQDSPMTPPQEVKENSTPSSISAEGGVKKNTDTKEETQSKEMVAQPKGSVTSIRSSGHVPIKTLVSVSWRVPRRSYDKHPGFHSDYSQPRTRNEISKSSSLAVSIKETDTQGSTRQTRSPVGFGSDAKKTTDINKNKLQDVEEVADYDPPHGTPPIHNRKTLTLRPHIL